MGNEDKYAQYPERPSDSRVRYFDGQFLGSQDFIDEQRYHVDRMRRHTAQLRIRGVSDGLGVSATGVLKVKIEAGTAIDDRGRQLVLAAARELVLAPDLVKPAQYVLGLVFAQATDRTMGGTGDQKGTRGDTRFRDDVTISVHGVGKAAPEGAVAVALLTVDAGGAVVVSTPAEVRVYSGLRLGGPGSATLTSGGDPRPKDVLLAGNLRIQGTLSVGEGISTGNLSATRALQIGGVEDGVGVGASDQSPNAGYIRFGDNTGWRLHFARAKDSPNAGPNQGPGAALMTVHDSGQVSIGTVQASEQVGLRVHGASIFDQWAGRLVAGGDNNVVIAGEWNTQATLGARNNTLGAWSDLVINPGGRVGIATQNLDAASLTVEGITVLRTGGVGGWDRLIVTTTRDWGDGESQYVTLGAGGANGIMLSTPHVPWRDSAATIRYGRTGGAAGNTYWDAGVRPDGSFSWVPYDNSVVAGSELLKLSREGWVGFLGRAPLYFTHGWRGFPDSNHQSCEVSNDIDGHKCLMLVGNRSAGGERRVGVWDRLDVNGMLVVNQGGPFAGLRVTNHTNRGVYMNMSYEGGNDTFVLYHQNGLGNFMRQDGVWQRNSDRSLKHDITPLHDALELALQLRPVRYKWNATGTPCLGFVAQEVSPLFPELVSETTQGSGDAEKKVLGLKYDTFGVIAIAAVQQLKQQLEAKLAALDAQLRELAGAHGR